MINTQVICHTTPQQLRLFADILESKWKKIRLGDKIPEVTIHHETIHFPLSVEVILRINQEDMQDPK